MSKSGIFCKIDWYSAMFYSCSINDILRWLHIDFEDDEFFSNSFSRALGYDTQVTYANDGVSIAVSYSLVNHFAVDLSNSSVFDFVFDRLRLDISGSGLDSMREKWLALCTDPGDFDAYLRTFPELPRGDMRVTRCDFAFDMIDYQPKFLDMLIHHLDFVTAKGYSRCPIMHTQGGLKYSVRTGDQRTVYLGSTRSDKLLRVYDKRMQLTDENGVWLKSVGHSDCTSWIRLELQTRNQVAHGLCFGEGDYMSIFRYVYDTYCFRDVNYAHDTCRPAKFWDDLFDWSNVPPIIQNLHCAQTESVYDRAHRFVFGTAFRSLCILMAHDGVDRFLSEVYQFLHDLQTSPSFELNKKWRSLLLSLHSVSASYDNRISMLRGVTVDHGELFLSHS